MQVLSAFFGNRTYVLLFLPLIMAGYFFCNFFTDHHHLENQQIHLGFWGQYQGNLYTSIGAMIIVLSAALVLNIIYNRNEFREKNTYTPSLILIVVSSFYDSFYILDGLMISMLMISLSILQIFRLSQNEDGRRYVFNASIFYGIAATFYPALILLFPFIIWVIWVLRPFVFREAALSVIGFILPLVYAGTFAFYMNITIDSEHFSSSPLVENIMEIVLLGAFILLLFLFSLSPLMNKLRQSSIRLKKLFRIIMLLFIALSSVFLVEALFLNKVGASLLGIVPLTFILPYSFGDRELKFGPSALFYLIFILSVCKFFILLNF